MVRSALLTLLSISKHGQQAAHHRSIENRLRYVSQVLVTLYSDHALFWIAFRDKMCSRSNMLDFVSNPSAGAKLEVKLNVCCFAY